MCDIFILAGEASGDLHGAKLIEELLRARPNLKIDAVAGPKMRALPIQTHFLMENLQVMGFTDVILALPKIVKQFFAIRKKILKLNPKVVLCIDYPGFNLRLERSLRKKKYAGRLIHYIAPSVWAWGKKRIPKMAETLDLLLVFFPFEVKSYEKSSLKVDYVGHPLALQIKPPFKPGTVLALFPGSREAAIRRNLPMQLAAAKQLVGLGSGLKIGVSIAQKTQESLIHSLAKGTAVDFYPPGKTYELMRKARVAIATSGTVTLELALHSIPTVVNYAIRPFDLFLAQKIFKIDLPFYCIVNIILSRSLFPELFGPNFTLENLVCGVKKLWFDGEERKRVLTGCEELKKALGREDASCEAAKSVISLAF
jgi:lipid-A-disaccharide synthase